MGILIMIAQLVLSLSILIVLHEMGHFFPAKLFKTRVEKFYLFFDPWFELWKFKKGETEYGIGWLPLGGYVKISGMIDESFDTEQLAQEPQPWEFRSKPAWQRLIIMVGGVTVNFVLGFLIYSMLLFVWGEEYLPTENATYGVQVDSIGREMGFLPGDKVLGVGDLKLERLNSSAVKKEIVINRAKTIEIERNGQKQTLSVDEEIAGKLASYDFKSYWLYRPRVPFVVGGFTKGGSPSKEAGIVEGDQIIAYNGTQISFFDEFFDMVKADPKKETTIELTVARKDTLKNITDTVSFMVKTTKEGKIGAGPFGADYFFDMERQEYGFVESFPAGTKKGWSSLMDQVKAFGHMFTGKIKATDSLGSFISIGSLFGRVWDWERFWYLTGFLSLILAFINLLPIPALDGGHVMFLLYEVISGRKPSDKFLEVATMIGFVLLIGLMIFALGLDIFRLF